MAKVAVILSGCGVYDGSEINEVVISLLALEENGIEYKCFAPKIDQFHVVNHISGDVIEQRRNVLIESARIVRGNISDIEEINISEFDGIFIPGGFGVAKNLSNFASAGDSFEVNSLVSDTIKQFYQREKVIVALCISPVVIAKLIGNGVNLTIGTDLATANVINKVGGEHVKCNVEDICYDTNHKVLTTPCYMLGNNLVEIKNGIYKLVAKLKNIL
ncbi:isoprenoid biosynthesis protein ElbB [Chromobacterium amazonense]|uniref:Isoprenoid biosynthesis protein ElbB n=1 Tax=Chromobacterium amazonense TaxID=1382803 RepID=A0A2S9WYG8_9NEIS|nr:isoprenoid biosynthesis glyoxalase ElbB [Chromobacterium amazonense]PRP68511.1 isoprenoid biosynthesis protein ElbB [Chromobacterium amazonense]